MKLCVCGFNLADAEPNAEGRYFCPWSGHEFEESDVKEAKSTSATEPEPEPEPETPSEPAAEAEPEPEPAPEPEPEPETPGEEKRGD